MLSLAQNKLIHVAKRELDLSDREYRHILNEVAGVRSSKALDSRSFRRVIETFKSLGFVTRDRMRNMRVEGGASIAQIDYIRSLWARYTGHSQKTRDHRRTLAAFIRKKFEEYEDCQDLIEIENTLDPRTAHIVIGWLKRMVDKNEKIRTQEPVGSPG